MFSLRVRLRTYQSITVKLLGEGLKDLEKWYEAQWPKHADSEINSTGKFWAYEFYDWLIIS